jgi:hypothetical protein
LGYRAAGGTNVGKEESRMKAILTTVAVAAAMIAFGASEASAWVCRADGVGSRGFGRAYFIADAKLVALRKCERRSAVPVCTITWCR